MGTTKTTRQVTYLTGYEKEQFKQIAETLQRTKHITSVGLQWDQLILQIHKRGEVDKIVICMLSTLDKVVADSQATKVDLGTAIDLMKLDLQKDNEVLQQAVQKFSALIKAMYERMMALTRNEKVS